MDDKNPIPITSIGEIRGLFDIFLPGLFLLLHLIVLIYFVSASAPARVIVSYLSDSPAKAAVFIVPAAYVLGLALRLSRTNPADRVSRWLFPLLPSGRKMLFSAQEWHVKRKLADSIVKPETNLKAVKQSVKKSLRSESFPYPLLMVSRIARGLPDSASEFYENEWSSQEGGGEVKVGLFRFDFWKIAVASIDERAAREMYAAEVMVRHAANMCYALFFSGLSLYVSAVLPLARAHELKTTLIWLATGEILILIGVLLPNLRLLRIAEVELVFTSCFIKKQQLRQIVSS